MIEFLQEYWWTFAVLFGVILLLLIGIAVSSGKKSTDKKTSENKTEVQTEVAETKPAEAEKKKIEAKPFPEPKTEKIADKKEAEVEKTKETSVKETAPAEKQKTQKYIVAYDKEKGDWVVKKTTSSRASKRCKTKAEAVKVAERLAETQELNLSVKKRDGKFQKHR